MVQLRLREFLDAVNLQVADVSKQMGIARQSIDRWCNDQPRRIDLDKVEAITAALTTLVGWPVSIFDIIVDDNATDKIRHSRRRATPA